MTLMAQGAHRGRPVAARGFPGGGALRLLRATKSHSAVAPVSGSATGDFEAANTGSFSQHSE
ncbi:hypothetical protein ASV09_21630 [Klebsiella aerogenes]|nr:hypothetical protein SS11_20135 [Klebsiella aerogenes]KJM99796.1 hypothetical protein SS60_21155 [Klebsiella aerogenes]KJP10822.1 hypothetical protein SR67_18695 [Klebsiella aerogenes]KLE50809.1 hypothetical protein YA12_08655 [Klebsiella aerogenes]KLE60663.1 hypothetical protein YA14_04600 [Klebsiella aerogenes]